MNRKYGLFSIQAAGTLALLWLLFRGFDWSAFRAVIGRVSPAFILGGFIAVVAGHLMYAWRWQTVLAAMNFRLRYSEVLRQYLVGMFFGNLMPTAVGGDAVKVYYLGRQVGYVGVGASVFVDRFLGFFWLSLIGAILSWRVGGDSALLVLNRNLLSGVAVLFAAILAVVWVVPPARLVPPFLRRGRLAPIVEKLLEFAGYVRIAGCRPWTLAVSAIVVGSTMVVMAVVYQQYFAATSVTVPALAPTLNALISMAVFINVPLSVNGIGLREQLHYLLFDAMGLPKEVSVSLSLLVFGYQLVLSFVGYLIWMRLPSPAATEAS